MPGASHLRSQPPKPNQDAICLKQDPLQPSTWVVTLADGHGSSKAFRSEIGAKFAVETAAEILWGSVAMSGCSDEPSVAPFSKLSYEEVYALTKQQLPARIVRAWIEKVEAHLQENPFSQEELQHCLSPTDAARQVSRKSPSPDAQIEAQTQALIRHYPYGTTLLGVVVTDDFFLYLQLGDGDIVCVDVSGDVYRPLEKDQRLIANETTSLCIPEAWSELRIMMQPTSARSPAMIMVSTDGYSNSFATEDDFFQAAIDFHSWIQKEGITSVESELEEILTETTQKGSGDDITLGILSRISWSNSGFNLTEAATDLSKQEEKEVEVEVAEGEVKPDSDQEGCPTVIETQQLEDSESTTQVNSTIWEDFDE